MAMVNCPECNNLVSTMAATCPRCAYPLNCEHIQTIEQTSKKHKSVQATGCGLILFGIVVFMLALRANMQYNKPSDDANSMYCFLFMTSFLVGLIFYITGKVSAWWNNG